MSIGLIISDYNDKCHDSTDGLEENNPSLGWCCLQKNVRIGRKLSYKSTMEVMTYSI